MAAKKFNNKKNKSKSRKNNKNKKTNGTSSSSSSNPVSGLSTPLSGQSTPMIQEVSAISEASIIKQEPAQLTAKDVPAQLKVKDVPAQLKVKDAPAQLTVRDAPAQLKVIDAPAPFTPEEPAPVATPELVFMDLTCDRDHEYDIDEEHISPSTHDLAEFMLYSFVDSSPYVADLIYSKQVLKQGEFLTLTDGRDWSDEPTIEFSTHEPYY